MTQYIPLEPNSKEWARLFLGRMEIRHKGWRQVLVRSMAVIGFFMIIPGQMDRTHFLSTGYKRPGEMDL